MAEATSAATQAVNRKARTGTVVSDRGDQTIIVSIARAAPHRLYRKVIRRTRRYPVHDPENAASVGDIVRIEECRPISKTKRWRLVEVVQEREVAQVAAASIDVALVSEVQRSAAHAAGEQLADEQPADERSAADEQPAYEHPDAELPADEPAADEQPAAGQPTEELSGEEQPTDEPVAVAAPESEDQETEPGQQ